ncbi:BPM2 [Symbiodinium natans]|uniref:BPM2 protein n=1 Tax=Symbiodinium natans TaxID=878477 RepID=A0A812MY42_9DINO|nr:BPM2 [Symbiodinium natans]
MAGLTAEELRAEIEAAKQQAAAEDVRARQIDIEVDEATERQRLRRELEQARATLSTKQTRNRFWSAFRDDVDKDRAGKHLADPGKAQPHTAKPQLLSASSIEQCTSFGHAVARGEYVWKLQQVSWLPSMLRQEELLTAQSEIFWVDTFPFQFVYNPNGGDLDSTFDPHDRSAQGSVAIMADPGEAVLLRYRIYVKARSGSFVQWGETCDEVLDGDVTACGPDVSWHDQGHPSATGLFGLTFKQLLQSEWVEDDTLTLKFVLEVRPEGCYESKVLSQTVEVPEATMNRDTKALLEKGTCSDVRFIVQGEDVHAHSQVLCARSEVLEKQLTGGMQETASKVIVVEDCDVAIFKAFLQFLYTDRLPTIDELAAQAPSDQRGDGNVQLLQMQALLAVSHKYQATRLQRWCEAQLCERLSSAEVCGILGQAHLFQAKQLEKACLAYIKRHLTEVLKLPAYAEMVAKWPEIGMKLSLFSAGVPEAEAAAVVEASSTVETCHKRRRLQSCAQEQDLRSAPCNDVQEQSQMNALLLLLFAGPCIAVRQQLDGGDGETDQITIRKVRDILEGEEYFLPEKPHREREGQNLMQKEEQQVEVEGCPRSSTEWQLTGKTLGQGAMGKVVEVSASGRRGSFALKIPLDWDAEEDAKLEVAVMKASALKRCDHVMTLTEASPCVKGQGVNRMAYVAPEMAGDLDKWLRQSSARRKNRCGQSVVEQLVSGMKCLHSAGYIHGDFKPDNVFYKELDSSGCPSGVVLADFGLSHRIGSTMSQYSSRYYPGSHHLPGSIFSGASDTLHIATGRRGQVEVREDIDRCSLKWVASNFFGIQVNYPLTRGTCGPMGPRR